MRNLKIFSTVLFLLVIIFAGCEKNDISSINGPANENDVTSLAKHGFGNFGGSNVHAVYSLTNSAAGNAVVVFKMSGHGTLTQAGTFSTGGTGSGTGLGSQGSLVLDRGLIFACNAGSNDVSVLSVSENGLTLADKKPSGGTAPISLTVHGRLLYVLNSGTPENITGFTINNDGTIKQIGGSTQPLSGTAVGPAQIEFSPSGRVLVVTEKAANMIDTYIVGHDGIAGAPVSQLSTGTTPYGFEFDSRGRLIVSDAYGGNANAGAMSSYNVSAGGISLITGPVYDQQTAPCWVAVTKNGRFAYTTNTGTSNISGYTIRHNGGLALFHDGGNTASTGSGSSPIDMAVSSNSQYLYALSHGTNTISVFRIGNGHGRLHAVQTIGGLESSEAGLAAN
ncbi:MAG: beta-propeller fold lactonase family protein [Ignavibacteriaceae bacterium]